MTIVACVSDSSLSYSVCDYGIELAKDNNLPLTLLNISEQKTKKITPNKDLVNDIQDKNYLESLKKYALSKGVKEVVTKQDNSSLKIAITKLEHIAKIVIIGLKKQDDNKTNDFFEKQIENILKSICKPVMLVNKPYIPIRKILIAYDGSLSSKKALDGVIEQPLFPKAQKDIISVNNANAIQEAKEKLLLQNLRANFAILHGDPVAEMIKYQKEHHISLMAMGSFGHTKLHHLLFGSTTHQMLLESDIPLLFLR